MPHMPLPDAHAQWPDDSYTISGFVKVKSPGKPRDW